MMHRRLASTILLAAGLALTGTPAADARSSYCTPSGDYCKSTYQRKGVRYFELRTAALYAPPPRYRLCVKDPDGVKTCRRFRLRERRFGWVGRVRWSRHFPTDGGRGVYRVRWKDDGLTYGPRLSFRR